MSRQLDLEIRRAMGELAEAAPLARPVEDVETPSTATRPRPTWGLALLGACLAVGGLAVWAVNRSDSSTSVSPATSRSDPISSTSSTSAGEAAAARMVLAPVGLPAGLELWSLREMEVPAADEAPFAQLFGRHAPGNDTMAVSLVVYAQRGGTPSAGDGTTPIEVRGIDGVTMTMGEMPVVHWQEDGTVFTVYYQGLTDAETVAALDKMQLRADSWLGFDPASAPLDLPLIVEDNPPAPGGRTTYMRLTATGATPSEYSPTILISNAGWTMDPPAMFVALGTKQADGSYEAPMTSYLPERVMARYSILPDHSVVWITGDDPQQRQAILDSLKLLPAAERYDLQNAASDRLGTVPEVARQKFDAGVLVLRGSDLDHVEALCLIIDGTEACRPTNATQPFDLVANVVIDGRWYFAGVDRNEVDWRLASFDGTPTGRIDLDDPRVAPREEAALGDARLWIVALPLDVDRVRRGPVIAGAVDFTGTTGQVFVRPDR